MMDLQRVRAGKKGDNMDADYLFCRLTNIDAINPAARF
jgi:hypothetical protein